MIFKARNSIIHKIVIKRKAGSGSKTEALE